MLNKESHRTFLRELEAYDQVAIAWDVAMLDRPDVKNQPSLDMDRALFFAMREHKQLVFPEVSISEHTSERYELQLTGKHL